MEDYSLVEQIVPEIEQYVGTLDVDAKEIEGRFPGAYNAISLVNEFDSSLLTNIAYIYNLHDEAAFGVFNPSLNETINWMRVKDQLEKEGFQTNIKGDAGPEDKLYAYSPNVPAEQIEQRMEQIFQQKSQTGGVAIGIDSNRIQSAVDEIVSDPRNSSLTDQQKNDLKIVQLASIIAHEATHAKGEHGESTPEAVQDAVLNYAITKFKIPVTILGEKIRADSNLDWYKKAQIAPFNSKLIEVILRSLQQQDVKSFNLKIEKNDSIEKILDNNQHTNDKGKRGNKDSEDKIMEKNLTDEHPEEESPKITEKQLQQQRPHPLIVNIPKSSESKRLIKEARYGSNNGGAFIGGVFSILEGEDPTWGDPFEADEIDDNYSSCKSSGSGDPGELYWRRRYNPLFARGGISTDRMGHPYFKFDFQLDLASMEYRNRPTRFWDRDPYWPNRSDIAVMGSKGYLSKEDDLYKNFVVQILRKIGYYRSLINSGQRKAVRLILDEKALQHALEAMAEYSYILLKNKKNYVMWIVGLSNEDEVREVEDDISNNTNIKRVNDFVGLSNKIKTNLNKIFSKCKLTCNIHGIHNVFAVGGFVRTLATTKDYSEINDLDFTAIRPDDCLKLGGLIASEFGVYDIGYYHRTKTISFEVDGVKMDFRGNYVPFDIRPLLRQYGIETTPLNFDIYARDFTVNSLIYSFNENKIYDVSGIAFKDIEAKRIRTFFDPDVIIPLNPILITRALALNLRGYNIDDSLDASLHKSSQEIFNGKVPEDRLAYEYEKIVKYGEDGIYLLEQYGITKLKEIRDKIAQENPELFSE